MEKKIQMYKLALDDGYQSNPLIVQTTPEKAEIIKSFLHILEEWDEWNERAYSNIIFLSASETNTIVEL